jgi:hypothetical protein
MVTPVQAGWEGGRACRGEPETENAKNHGGLRWPIRSLSTLGPV